MYSYIFARRMVKKFGLKDGDRAMTDECSRVGATVKEWMYIRVSGRRF
jgi:hypothetical protein